MDDDYKIKPCFQNKHVHIKSYDGDTKWMHFSIEDNELLKKYNKQKTSSNSKMLYHVLKNMKIPSEVKNKL